MELKNFQQARVYAEKAIAENPQFIEAYLLLSEFYAEANISKDMVIDRTKYWMAFDILQRAIEHAPDNFCTENIYFKAKEYINLFPTKKELSERKDMNEGKAYRVGGWIGRNTVCRSREETEQKY